MGRSIFPSYKVGDLAEAIGPNCIKKYIGIRNGEKMHEEMITSADSFNTYDLGSYFTIIQPSNEIDFDKFLKHKENGDAIDSDIAELLVIDKIAA